MSNISSNLGKAALERDALTLRSLVQDISRLEAPLIQMPSPDETDPKLQAAAASLIELLAERTRQLPPAWTASVPKLEEPFYLLQNAERMQRLRALCDAESPEPLAKRGFRAPANFLEFV